MLRQYHDEVPYIFRDNLDLLKSVHNHDARQKDHLYIPIIRIEQDKNRVTYRSPVSWNQI